MRGDTFKHRLWLARSDASGRGLRRPSGRWRQRAMRAPFGHPFATLRPTARPNVIGNHTQSTRQAM
jgi:hypothetical protein